jgi:hypothetical protein
LKSLRDRDVPEFYRNSAVGLRRVLSHKEQIENLLVNKVVITPDILLVDLQARGRSKKMLNLVGTLDTLVLLRVVHRIEWIHPGFVHFRWPSSGLSLIAVKVSRGLLQI